MTAPLEFDNILRQIGECGKYQIVMYIFLGIVGIPTGWQNLAMVFLGGNQDHWCAVPGSESLSESALRNLSLTHSRSNDTLDQCMFYDVNYTQYYDVGAAGTVDVYVNGTEPAIKKCTKWVYDTSEYTSTIRSQWDLVCDNEYMVSLATSIYMAGFLTGAILFGSVSDLIGRKKTLLICIFTEIIAAVAAAVASRYGHYAAFVVLRFIVANVAGGSFTVAFVIVMEILGGRWRMYLGIWVQGWFALGFLSISGIAYFIRDHFTLQLAIAFPVVALLSYYWILPESPRWLYAENRPLEAEAIVRNMAKHNNKPFPKELDGLKQIDTGHRERATLLDILRKPRMRTRLFITFFIWFVNSLVYYGISYNADSLGGGVYVNSAISGAVELPAYVMTCFFLDRAGRRWMLVATMIGGGASLVASIPVMNNPDYQWVVVVLANGGKFGISASFAIIYVFTAELFPTVVRNAAVGSGSMCARLGGLLAPQIVRLDKIVWFALPALLMGALSVMAGLLSLLLPETSGKRLPETLEDGEDFGTKKYIETHGKMPSRASQKPLVQSELTNMADAGDFENGTVQGDAERTTFSL